MPRSNRRKRRSESPPAEELTSESTGVVRGPVSPPSTMRVTRFDSYYRVFVLKDDDLTRLVQDFQVLIGPVRFELECADSVTRHADSLHDLATFDNPPSKAIRRLKIIAQGSDGSNSAYLRLSADREKNVQIVFDAREDAATRINDRIEDRVESMRPWYSPLRRGSVSATAFVIWLATMIVGNDRGWFVGKNEQVSDIIRHQSEVRWSVVTGLIAGIGIITGLLREKYFPVGAFAIGQGASDYNRSETIRILIIGCHKPCCWSGATLSCVTVESVAAGRRIQT